MKKIIDILLAILSVASLIILLTIGSTDSGIDSLILISDIVLWGSLIAIVIFSILHIIRYPKLLKKTLILIAGSVVLFGICYSMSDSTPVAGSSESASAMTDTLLYIFYFLIFAAIGSLLLFGIKKTLKK